MTVSIAVTGKSGSGKTTLAKAILDYLHTKYPEKSVLIVDNDLSHSFSWSFDREIKYTAFDIRTGNYKHKAKLPEGMSKQEYIEWALQDIIVNIGENIDIIATGIASSKDCRCPITQQIDDALSKLIKTYDIVIFDCEYDLLYLHQIIDCYIDATVIVSEMTAEAVYLAEKIKESSQKYAYPGQLGLVLNKVKENRIPEDISAIISKYDLPILGILRYNKDLKNMTESIQELLFRLNLPQL